MVDPDTKSTAQGSVLEYAPLHEILYCSAAITWGEGGIAAGVAVTAIHGIDH